LEEGGGQGGREGGREGGSGKGYQTYAIGKGLVQGMSGPPSPPVEVREVGREGERERGREGLDTVIVIETIID